MVRARSAESATPRWEITWWSGPGQKFSGGITIGDNVKIGANSVVLKSVPANSTVIGVPGRIIKSQGERLPDATMDHTNMPDPTADRFAALESELIELRKKLEIGFPRISVTRLQPFSYAHLQAAALFKRAVRHNSH